MEIPYYYIQKQQDKHVKQNVKIRNKSSSNTSNSNIDINSNRDYNHLIDYLFHLSVNNHTISNSTLIRCLCNHWELKDIPLSYIKEFSFNFNSLLSYIKRDNITYYEMFLEFIECQDKELEPGEFYDTLYIELRFISLTKNSNVDWFVDDIDIIALKWEISFIDEKEGESLEFNSYELNTSSIVTSEFVSYKEFFEKIEEDLCKENELVNECYSNYKLNLLCMK